MSVLESLCMELLLGIADCLDRQSLVALSRCSKELNSLLRPGLFKTLVLYPSTVFRAIRWLRKDAGLAALVQHLTIDCGIYDVCYASDALLPSLSSLHSLNIKGNETTGPYRPDSSGLGMYWPINAYRSFETTKLAVAQIPAWLPHLKTCIIDLKGPDMWAMEHKAMIFLHSTLEHLEMSSGRHIHDTLDSNTWAQGAPSRRDLIYCETVHAGRRTYSDSGLWGARSFRSPIWEVDPSDHQTDLKTLKFRLCQLNASALNRILKFPRGLENFSLNLDLSKYCQRHHDDDNCTNANELKDFCGSQAHALMKHIHSLLTLELRGSNGDESINLSAFTKLQRLDIDTIVLMGAVELGDFTIGVPDSPGERERGPCLSEILPNSLKDLTLRYWKGRTHEVYVHFTEMLFITSGGDPMPADLKRVTIVEQPVPKHRRPEVHFEAAGGDEKLARRALEKFTKYLTRRGIEVRGKESPMDDALPIMSCGQNLVRAAEKPIEWHSVHPPGPPRWSTEG